MFNLNRNSIAKSTASKVNAASCTMTIVPVYPDGNIHPIIGWFNFDSSNASSEILVDAMEECKEGNAVLNLPHINPDLSHAVSKSSTD